MAKKYHYEEVRENEFAWNFGIFQIGIAVAMAFLMMYLLVTGAIYKMSGLMVISNLIILIANAIMGANNLDKGEKMKRVRVYDPEPVEPGKPISDDALRKKLLGDQ